MTSRAPEPTRVIADALACATNACVTSSFQAEDVALVHMLRQVRADLPVLFLDTVHHFPQTLEYRDRIVREWNLNLVTLKAEQPEPGLWEREGTDTCCQRHKVEPLFKALQAYDTWFTGLRREQSPSRMHLREVDPFRLPGGQEISRVSPLAAWTAKDVRAYASEHDIPLLPLYDLGYTSIGCEPCTQPPPDLNNPRSGRWQGKKLECGIHIPARA